jgi:hypothetical protein
MTYRTFGGYVSPKRPKRDRPITRPRAAPCSCTTRIEGDECACHCGLRWPFKEERPPCPSGA